MEAELRDCNVGAIAVDAGYRGDGRLMFDWDMRTAELAVAAYPTWTRHCTALIRTNSPQVDLQLE